MSGYGSAYPRGVASWLLTDDHKRVAILFLAAIAVMLGLGGLAGILVRIELLTPAKALVDEHGYNRLFTAHGLILVALFVVPAIPATFGNYLLPLMIGARRLAFPRLALGTFYLYVGGAAAVLVGLVRGGVDSGWTIYPPSGESSPDSVAIVLGGLALLGVGWLATAANFIATIHRHRAPGMGFLDMPPFVWSLYATSLVAVVATLVFAVGLALVGLGLGGGDLFVRLHLRWFYAHAAVYTAIVPAAGVASELILAFARKNALSYRALVLSFVGIAAASLVSWGHHVFAAGSTRDAALFGIPSLLLATSLAVAALTWAGTLYGGSIAPRTPLLYGLAFVFFLFFGVASGVGLAAGGLGAQWHGTWFVVAHFHCIVAGGMLSAFLGALHFWFPKMTGRMYSERFALLAAAPIFVGLCLAFFPEFLLGNAGMPRRSPTYPAALEPLHVIAAAGSWVLAAGLAGALGVLVGALRWGAPAEPNPWGAGGLEWATSSPPPPENFEKEPRAAGELRDLSRVP
jgi:cytochrome c oxidase subunit 1